MLPNKCHVTSGAGRGTGDMTSLLGGPVGYVPRARSARYAEPAAWSGDRALSTALLQGGPRLPVPRAGYWAASVASNASFLRIRVYDDVGLELIPPSPPYFFKCAAQTCKGGEDFSCEAGYTGTLCNRCAPGQFDVMRTCTTSCSSIEPQFTVTAFAMLGVVICWVGMNKLTAGRYVLKQSCVVEDGRCSRSVPMNGFAAQLRCARCRLTVRRPFSSSSPTGRSVDSLTMQVRANIVNRVRLFFWVRPAQCRVEGHHDSFQRPVQHFPHACSNTAVHLQIHFGRSFRPTLN